MEDRLVTPEGVQLDLATATVATRALARMIDIAVQTVALIAVASVTGLAGPADAPVALTVVLLLALFAIYVLYPMLLEWLWGATIGHRALGLRIVSTDGSAVRFRQALARAAVGLLEIYLTFGTLAAIVALSRRDGRRLGDLVAGTVAVSVRSGSGRAEVLDVTCPPRLVAWAETLDTTSLGPEERTVLRRYLERAAALPAPRRDQLALPLAERLLARMVAAWPPGGDADAVLRAVHATATARLPRPADLPPPTARTPGPPPVAPPVPPPAPAAGDGFQPPA